METSPLLQLPSELRELNVCRYLDAITISNLSLVNRQLQHDITNCSQLWATLVTRYFGYMTESSLMRLGSSREESVKGKVCWRNVFVATWQDLLSLTSMSLQANDVLDIYYQKRVSMHLQPCEAQIRQEIVLMQGLQRIPTSVELIQLYATVIRQGLEETLPTRRSVYVD